MLLRKNSRRGSESQNGMKFLKEIASRVNFLKSFGHFSLENSPKNLPLETLCELKNPEICRYDSHKTANPRTKIS